MTALYHLYDKFSWNIDEIFKWKQKKFQHVLPHAMKNTKWIILLHLVMTEKAAQLNLV